MTQIYDNDSGTRLKGPDRVRLRPGIIFGSSGAEGAAHAYFEILSNAVDEARAGFGKVIKTTVYHDGTMSVEDEGRGIPMEWNNNEEIYNWDLYFNTMYGGAKFEDDGNYDSSLGLNGLGATSTQYASEFMNLQSKRDGYIFEVDFKKGYPLMKNGKPLPDDRTKKQYDSVLNKTKQKGAKSTGTKVTWKLDMEVFSDTTITKEYFLDTLKRQSIVNDNLKFIIDFVDEDGEIETHEFYYPEGILGYVRELSDGKEITTPKRFYFEGRGRDREDKPIYNVRASVAFTFNNHNPEIQYYHNSSHLTDGGSPDRAVKNAFVYAFDKELKDQNKYKAKETKISFSDIEDSLIILVTTFSNYTEYDHQTKKAISNKFIREMLTEQLRESLRVWIIENKQESDQVLEQILVNKRSREDAEKNRVNVRKKLMKKVNPFNNSVDKFVDCRSKDTNKRELFIVEGDSALSSVKDGRNAEFQGIMPVRGKILNCLKSSLSTIMKSEVITDLIKVMGCGVEIPTKSKKADTFDLDKLQWNKIIITTDADVDGFQIRTLILAMLYRLTPTLIEEGYVYIAETPLYEITILDKGKEEVVFAYDESEKDEMIKGVKKYKLQRSKGLGENDPEMMWNTTLNPETRRLIKVTPEDSKVMFEAFDLFLGNNLQGRKQYIEENSHLYMEDLDVD